MLVEVTRGSCVEVSIFGPAFSNQVWSTIWLAMVWPNRRLILGVRRCITAGKKPSMLEKWWGRRWGAGLNCLFVREASSNAVKRPRMVTIRALSFNRGGIVIIGVFRGRMFEVIKRPATMLPQARRLIGFITAGLFSLMGGRGIKRGCPIDTK